MVDALSWHRRRLLETSSGRLRNRGACPVFVASGLAFPRLAASPFAGYAGLLHILADHGTRGQLVYTDVPSGRSLQRPGWQALMEVVKPGDRVVGFLDRFSRNFEEGVWIQAELPRGSIGIVAIRENIDTREGSAAAKFFRCSMLAQGVYQVNSASERTRLGLERTRAEGRRVGRPPTLSQDVVCQEQVELCRRRATEGAGLRQIARMLGCSPAPVKQATGEITAKSDQACPWIANA